MAFFQVVFRTQGQAQTFATTNSVVPIFQTSNTYVTFPTTVTSDPLFQTGNEAQLLFATTASFPLFVTPSQATVFLTTVDDTTAKLLQVRIGTLGINTDQTVIDVPDATGEYNPADPNENPGGYNPASATNDPARPKRSQVKLWTVYKIRSGENPDYTLTPSTQSPWENYVDYVYPLTLPTETVDGEEQTIKGLYEIILIAAPVAEQYSNYEGNTNLAEIAKQTPFWFSGSVGVMIDTYVTNCLNKKRYSYLQGIMCGKCDESYLSFYADYVGMLSAMEIGDWVNANLLYDKLKTQCNEEESSCGC